MYASALIINFQDKYLDEFKKTVPILKTYDRNVPDRVICAFVPGDEARLEALENGAKIAGGQEMITEVAKGRIDTVSYFGFLVAADICQSRLR